MYFTDIFHLNVKINQRCYFISFFFLFLICSFFLANGNNIKRARTQQGQSLQSQQARKRQETTLPPNPNKGSGIGKKKTNKRNQRSYNSS